MNIVERRNIPLSVGIGYYSQPLYRVDKESDNRTLAASEFKYFTTSAQEARTAYSRYGQILRTWTPTRPLILLHLLDPETRNAVSAMTNEAGKTALNFSYPRSQNGVGRRSEENHVQMDYTVARSVCNMLNKYAIDGFYIPATENFHSEIVLCAHSFPTIQMIRQERIAPPSLPSKRKRAFTRFRNRSNSNSNSNMNPPPIQRRRTQRKSRQHR